MADRTLVEYFEERIDSDQNVKYLTGYSIEIQRSAAGQPGILVTIKNSLDEESTIVVKDGLALFAPVLEWLLTDELIMATSAEAAVPVGPTKWAVEGLARLARKRMEADTTEDGSPVQ